MLPRASLSASASLGFDVVIEAGAGLGSRIEDPSFTKQFKGKDATKAVLKKDGGDIDAISGATFSSIGATEAVKQASGWYAALKDTIATTW